MVTKLSTPITPVKKAKPTRTRCDIFKKYEDGRLRYLKFDVNALADFEQEVGMGFAQLMKQRAMFGAARAMLWAGLKHEDRGLTIEGVGKLMSQYLKDEEVEPGTHNIDELLVVGISAAVDQGALGRTPEPKKEEETESEDDTDKQIEGESSEVPNAVDGEIVDKTIDPSTTPQTQE